MKYIKRIILFILLILSTFSLAWGFYGHKLIAEWSVYSLPQSMMPFYVRSKDHLKETSVLPDILKNSVPKEYCRHYIDLEHWDTIINLSYNVDSCLLDETCFSRGILPYILKDEFNKLITAFRNKNSESIIRQSGVLSHYCSDLCVPLHTTENYDGQLTGQNGIHALWESYLLERFSSSYDLYEISAKQETDFEKRILAELYNAHHLVKPVLKGHKYCQRRLGDKALGFYRRKGKIEEGYSEQFQDCFHTMASSQIENQLRRSIQLTSDLWYTAWIIANKPNLDSLGVPDFIKKNENQSRFLHKKNDKRGHE